MTSLLRILMLVGVLAVSGSAVARPSPPTIEQLAAFPRMSSFTLSPDGRHMAALEARGEDRVILVWDTANLRAPPTVIGSQQMKITGVQFVKNDTLAVTLWQPYDFRGERVINTFVSKLFFTDLQGRNWREPLPLPRAQSEEQEREQARTSPAVLDLLPNDPDHVLLINQVGVNAGDVYRVNVHTNRAERILRQESEVAGYITDLQGNVRARLKAGTDGGGAYIATEFRPANGGGWSEHFRSYVRTRDQTEVIGFTADPNIALVRSNVGRDKAIIYEYDIAAGAQREVLFQHRFFEALNVSINRWQGPNFGEIQALIYAGPREGEFVWTSPRFQALDRSIRQAMNITSEPITFVDPATGDRATTQYDAQLYYYMVSATADLSAVVFYVEGPSRPRAYYLLRNGQVQLLSETYPQIDRASLGRTELVYYRARDGLDIPAFLTRPNAELCGPGPYRAVVHPHGGPWARDALVFDYSMWVPLMSSRCMAVLQPQFRGSQGWSRRLWLAGDAEWGQKMQDDLDDGARWMIEQRIANPQRIAMFGFSYGGYASMAAAIRPNGLYRCAIAGAGVSEIHRISRDYYENPFFRDAQRSTINGLNPLDQARNIQIPIMVYGGVRDQIVPIEQSQWFVAQARRSNQPVVYHEIQDYAHGPAWTRAIMAQQLRIIDEYFAAGCGQGGL